MFAVSTHPRPATVGALLVLALVVEAQAGLPIVENAGQWPDEVRYHAVVGGRSCTFTATGLVIRDATSVRTIRWTPDGQAMVLVGTQRQITRMNFFQGGDPARWRTDVPTYAAVEVRDADGRAADRWWLDRTGLHRRRADGPAELLIAAGAGATARHDDDFLLWSTYLGQIDSDKGLGVVLARNDCPVVIGRTRSLTFPTTPEGFETDHAGLNDVFVVKLSSDGQQLLWGTFLGSGGDDAGMAVSTDANDDLVLVGLASGPDWPTTADALATGHHGGRDAVVARLAGAGNALIWSTYLGGSGNDVANRVLVDANDGVVLVGETQSIDWPTTPQAHQTIHGGGWDVFVARIAPDGASLVSSTLLGGAGDDYGRGLAPIAGGQVAVVVGTTGSAVFPTTGGVLAPAPLGGQDGFVSALLPATGALAWSTRIGGQDDDVVTAVAAETDGGVLVVGGTHSSDFPTTVGAFAGEHAGNDDAFVARLTSNGTALDWSTLLGGHDADRALAVTRGRDQEVVVTGYTLSDDLPCAAGSFDATANGSYDAFLHRFDPTGHTLWSGTYLGGGARDETYALAMADDGRLAIAGVTDSFDFPITPDAFQTDYAGAADALVLVVSPWTLDVTAVTPAAATLPLHAWPNPFNPRVRFGLTAAAAGHLLARVFDARGRLVRVLHDGPHAGGPVTLVWDGRDARGRAMPSGTYLGEIHTGGRPARTAVRLVR